MFERIKKRWFTAREDVLWQWDDLYDRLLVTARLDETNVEIALVIETAVRAIRKRQGETRLSDGEKRTIAADLRKAAKQRGAIDLNGAQGFGIVSLWLESQTLPGEQAAAVRAEAEGKINGLLEGLARYRALPNGGAHQDTSLASNASKIDVSPQFGHELDGLLRRSQSVATRDGVVVALKTVGIALNAEAEDNQFCISAAVGVARAVMEKVGTQPKTLDDDDAFLAGLFAFVAANYVTQKIGGHFEIVALAAAALAGKLPTASATETEVFGGQMGIFGRSVADAFNHNRELYQAIGENIAAWLMNPNGDNLQRLASFFERMRSGVRWVKLAVR